MNADRLAPWYRWVEYAAFGHALERARAAMLHHLRDAERVLVIGEGDGRALQQMLAIAPQARFDVFEQSSAMIGLARTRIGANGRVRFFSGDVRVAPFPEPSYDAAVTLFVLDCFTPMDAGGLMSRIARHLAPQAPWIVGDFAIPSSQAAAWIARRWIAVMYLFFRLTTGLEVTQLPPIDEPLRALGFVPIESGHFRLGLVMSAVWKKEGPATSHDDRSL